MKRSKKAVKNRLKVQRWRKRHKGFTYKKVEGKWNWVKKKK